MEKEVITSKQAITIMAMFMVGTALIHIVQSKADQDFWVAYIFVIIITLFVFYVYGRIISLFPQTNLLDIFKYLFGKIAGSIIYASYVFYAFTLGSIIPRHFTEYIQTTSLPETPQYAYAICIILISIYFVKNGIETLGRWSMFSLPIIIFIFMFTIILSMHLFNINNLKPVFHSDFSLIAENTLNAFSLPFGESVLFLLLLDSLQNGKKSVKVFYISMAIAVAMFLIALFRNILVLGIANTKLLASPSLSAVSIIQITSFIERIEVIITIIFLICGMAKVTVCLLGACKGCAKLFKMDTDRLLAAPIGLFMLMCSLNFFENSMHLLEWFNAYRIFFIPQQIIFPLIAWITAEFKVKRQKVKTRQDKKVREG